MFHFQPCFSSTAGLGFEERTRKEAPNQALGRGRASECGLDSRSEKSRNCQKMEHFGMPTVARKTLFPDNRLSPAESALLSRKVR